MTAIDLNLEGDDLVYFSGQRVKGALVLQISVPIIIAGEWRVESISVLFVTRHAKKESAVIYG